MNEGDGRVLVLDVLTGAVIQDFVIEGGGFVIFSPVWSPDDSKLAVVSSTDEPSRTWIWERETGKLINSIPVQQFTSSQTMVWSSSSESLIFSDGQAFPVQITPPTANAGDNQTVDTVNETSAQITLDGSGSFDPDGEIVNYMWIENGVEITTNVNPQVTLDVGVHTVALIVTDDDGAVGMDEVVITVKAPTAIPTDTPVLTIAPSDAPMPTATDTSVPPTPVPPTVTPITPTAVPTTAVPPTPVPPTATPTSTYEGSLVFASNRTNNYELYIADIV